MATFNFDIKNESYEIALSQSKSMFLQLDMQTGAFYLDKALSLCDELYANCTIAELKNKYAQEGQKIRAIKQMVQKGINPFLPKEKTMTSNNGGSSSDKKEDKNKPEFFSSEVPKTTLADIAGLDDVKQQIELNVIAPFENPEIYFKYKESTGCRILLYGPPGCGKTFVAEAIAGQLKCAYAVINTHDILDKYVGEAPKKIKAIFEEAKQYKNCLIFFDELETLFASRDSDESAHTKDVLTSLLTCMSGFGTQSKDTMRVIIGATNRPWALDSALLRGKRFDTHIYVGLPDEEARRFMIERGFKKTKELLQDTDVSVDILVQEFDGYSGADISSMIEKMHTLALGRALKNKANNVDKREPVTYADVTAVKNSCRNSITQDMLDAFEAFKNKEI